MVEIDEKVKKWVEEKNVKAVKLMLTSLAYGGDAGSFGLFKDSAEYAFEKLGDIFDVDNGAAFTREKTLDNYIKVAELMLSNFSEKKYNAVIEIGLAVFKPEEENIKVEIKEEKSPLSQVLSNPILIVIAVILLVAVIGYVITRLK